MIENFEHNKWYEVIFSTFFFYFKFNAGGKNYVQTHFTEPEFDTSLSNKVIEADSPHDILLIIAEYKNQFTFFGEIGNPQLTAKLECDKIEYEARP